MIILTIKLKGNMMKNTLQKLFLAIAILAMALPLFAGKVKTEEQVLADLDSPKDKVVIGALQDVEKVYPTSVPALNKTKGLLADPRLPVKRKAARVLGNLNASVSEADVKNIAILLSGTDKYEIIDGLKALRGLKAASTIPLIVPLLQHPDNNVKRDALRTLAVLGDKSLVPTIQPLLQFPELGVQKDAADALAILKQK
jgi:HEAT repeat protein